MVTDGSQPEQRDLDSTDKLPILEEGIVDPDVHDDAVPLEREPLAAAASSAGPAILRVASDFARAPGVDLPSLAESVRSVEDRIARQSAEYEALNQLYDKTRAAEAVAAARIGTLSDELAAVRSALALEQRRSQEAERALTEKSTIAENARKRADELMQDWERYQSEIRSMRDSLAARDATIVQVLHSLGERDAQLSALQREHAKVVPDLEARSQASAALDAQMRELRADAEAKTRELEQARRSLSALEEQVKRGEQALNSVRQELRTASGQSTSYLELLRTREWRRGFEQNRFLEWDAQTSAARAGHSVVVAERDRLKQTAAALSGRLIEQEDEIGRLRAAAAADAEALAKSAHLRAELSQGKEALEAECLRLRGEIEAREAALVQARTQGAEEAKQIEELKAEVETHEQELAVLMAHLNEARRPVEAIQADLKRANDELALKSSNLEKLSEENKSLRAALERARGALQEREFLIRRLERSESNSANALGRIQTSIEKLGATPAPSPGPVLGTDWLAQLVRIEGGQEIIHPLGRRTRIGRAPESELHIDSQSVSRHHALLVKGLRDLIIEDLNSTNGILVNGRKVSRLFLSDGDVLTIGETQFRCVLNPGKPAAGATPETPPPGPQPA